jgi:hypothetical protein
MGKDEGWPSVDEVKAIVGERATQFEVSDDIVRIALAGAG